MDMRVIIMRSFMKKSACVSNYYYSFSLSNVIDYISPKKRIAQTNNISNQTNKLTNI